MKSIFTDKSVAPTTADLENNLGTTFQLWSDIEAFTKINYPNAMSKWHFSGEKFGWSYRIEDHKRVLIYLLPRAQYFKVAFVFGEKAVNQILQSNISATIKMELQNAKKYAEGKGIRIDVNDETILSDVQKLIVYKIEN